MEPGPPRNEGERELRSCCCLRSAGPCMEPGPPRNEGERETLPCCCLRSAGPCMEPGPPLKRRGDADVAAGFGERAARELLTCTRQLIPSDSDAT